MPNENTASAGRSPFENFVVLLFGVVLGASLLEFRDHLFPPDLASMAFYGLVLTYFGSSASWEGWHTSVDKYPYTKTILGRLRALTDVSIVGTYVYLMVESVKLADSSNSMTGFLLGFAVTFLLYFASGMFRRWEYRNKDASRVRLILVHLGILIAIWITYFVWRADYGLPEVATWMFLFLTLLVQISYRYRRGWKELNWRHGGSASE